MRRRAIGLAALVAAAAAVAPAAPAGADSHICVAVVVDYRELAGAPSAPSRYCAEVPNRSTGYEILVARARALGRPQPRMENGLLCAIDGLPERGCGESTDGGYRYWAYYHRTGDGGWQYSSRGATDYRVIDDPGSSADDRPSEGWVWVDGGPQGSVQPAAIRYDDICPPKPRPTRSTTAARPTPSPRPVPSPRPSPRSPRPLPAPGPDVAETRAVAARAATPAGSRAATAATTAAAEAPQQTSEPATPSESPPGADVDLAAPVGSRVPVSTVVGVALVGAVAAAARTRVRRGTRE